MFLFFREEEIGEPFAAESIEKVVISVAKALDYLHRDHRLLHGDMKSGNVLVKGDFDEVKLCDFGVTCPLDADLKVTAEETEYVGTGPWCAKEALDATATVSDKTDVFALGKKDLRRIRRKNLFVSLGNLCSLSGHC